MLEAVREEPPVGRVLEHRGSTGKTFTGSMKVAAGKRHAGVPSHSSDGKETKGGAFSLTYNRTPKKTPSESLISLS